MDHITNPTNPKSADVLVVVLLCCMTWATEPVAAAPHAYRARAYTDNIDPNSPSFDPSLTGHRLHLEVAVASDGKGDVPDSIERVRAIGLSPNAPPDYDLPIFSQGFKFVGLPEFTGATGRWGIEAKMLDPPLGDGLTDAAVTHVLDKPALIPLADNIQFSDQSLTPIISWDPVMFVDDTGVEREVDFYKINIERDETYASVYESNRLTARSFRVPRGVLRVGEPAWFRITARHYDHQPSEGTDWPTSGYWIENQSRTWSSFTPLADDVPIFTWNVDGDGQWHAASNWTPANGPPDGERVVFGDVTTAPATVTANTNVNAHAVEFNNTNSYIINGSGTLNMRPPTNATPEIRVVTGSHELHVPVDIQVATEIHVAADAQLILQNPLSANSADWSKFGEGTLIVNANTALAGGTLFAWDGELTGHGTLFDVQHVGGTFRPTDDTGIPMTANNYEQLAGATLELEIGGPTAGTEYDQLIVTNDAMLGGRLDLRLTGDYDPAYGEQFDLISAGEVDGVFRTIDGVSISADKAFAVTRDARAVVALPGDTNLDGSVDVSDFNIWNTYRSFPWFRSSWQTGDFNGDGSTDDQDFDIWNAHRFMTVDGAIAMSVPEPSSILMLFACTLLFRCRHT